MVLDVRLRRVQISKRAVTPIKGAGADYVDERPDLTVPRSVLRPSRGCGRRPVGPLKDEPGAGRHQPKAFAAITEAEPDCAIAYFGMAISARAHPLAGAPAVAATKSGWELLHNWIPPTSIGEGHLKLLDVDLRLSFVIKMTRVEWQLVDDSLESFESALQEPRNVFGGNIAILSRPGIFQELAVFR
jgi:hypothetical protein